MKKVQKRKMGLLLIFLLTGLSLFGPVLAAPGNFDAGPFPTLTPLPTDTQIVQEATAAPQQIAVTMPAPNAIVAEDTPTAVAFVPDPGSAVIEETGDLQEPVEPISPVMWVLLCVGSILVLGLGVMVLTQNKAQPLP